jgi:hypothetical protein
MVQVLKFVLGLAMLLVLAYLMAKGLELGLPVK